MLDLQLFVAMYDSIVNIFEFWTVVWTNWAIRRCHFGLVFISCSLSLKQRLEEMRCTVKYAVPFSPLNKNSMKEVCSVVLVRKGKKNPKPCKFLRCTLRHKQSLLVSFLSCIRSNIFIVSCKGMYDTGAAIWAT